VFDEVMHHKEVRQSKGNAFFFMLAVGLITAMAAISGSVWASLSKASAGESSDAPLPVFLAWVFDVLLGIFYVPGARQLGEDFANGARDQPNWIAILMLAAGIMIVILALKASRGSRTAYYAGVGIVGLGFSLSCFSAYQVFGNSQFLWMAVVFRVGVMYLLLHPIITGNLDLHASSGETTAEKPREPGLCRSLLRTDIIP
jgi:cytochrome bd-type quinol oxidase subunit 2